MRFDAFNTAPPAEVEPLLKACCDSPRWIAAVRDARPYDSEHDLLNTADRFARALSDDEVAAALAAHPRIGERPSGASTQSTWSRQEQSGVTGDAHDELAALNAAYEERFGQVFLICATGLSAADIVAAARERLQHDDLTERGVVKDELRKIALIRLTKALTP